MPAKKGGKVGAGLNPDKEKTINSIISAYVTVHWKSYDILSMDKRQEFQEQCRRVKFGESDGA